MEKRKGIRRIGRLLVCLLLAICIAGCGQEDDLDSPTGKRLIPKTPMGDIPMPKRETPDAFALEEQKLIEETKGPVTLKIWVPQEDYEMVTLWCENFSKKYPEITFRFEIGTQSEYSTGEIVMADVQNAADVYFFTGDRFTDLLDAGALSEITFHSQKMEKECTGDGFGPLEAVKRDGKFYAYPATSDNGYFLYYNKAYFEPEDVESLDRMLEVASGSGKKISMQLDSGWYNLSFFLGAGFHLKANPDGSTVCDWNQTSESGIPGTEVLQSMLDLAGNDGFAPLQDAEFLSGIADGSVIAGINGTWNARAIAEAWGDNYAAAKLPTFTCMDRQVQMSSVAGYKMYGVNPCSKEQKWSMLLAEYFTSYEQQLDRFEKRGAGPADARAAASEEVSKRPEIAALAMQSQYAFLDGCEGSNYWTPTEVLGTIIEEQNPEHKGLQKILDDLVEEVSKPASTN